MAEIILISIGILDLLIVIFVHCKSFVVFGTSLVVGGGTVLYPFYTREGLPLADEFLQCNKMGLIHGSVALFSLIFYSPFINLSTSII